MGTFSEIVDEMVRETRRVDLRDEIARYTNQTIREIHAEPTTNNVVLYPANYVETQITCDSETGQTWVNPRDYLFQTEIAVRFDNAYNDSDQIYATRMVPGPAMGRENYFYYRAGDTFVFGGRIGYGGVGCKISIAYYEYPRSLKYYAVADRPAVWDDDEGYTYHADYSASDELKLAARLLTTNWVLQRWAECIREGLRAKVYKRLSDDGRQRTSYSLFQQARRLLMTSEAADARTTF